MGQGTSKKGGNVMRAEAQTRAECEKQRRIMEKEIQAKFKLIDSLVGSSLTMKGMTTADGASGSRLLDKKSKMGKAAIYTDKAVPNTEHSANPYENNNMSQSASMVSDMSDSNAHTNNMDRSNSNANQKDLAEQYSKLAAYFEEQLKLFMKDRCRQIYIETDDGGERVVGLLARLFSMNVEDSLSNIAKNYKVDAQQRDNEMIFYHTNMLQRNFNINRKKNNNLNGSPRKEYQGQHSEQQKQNSKQIKQLRKSLVAIIASDKAFLASQLIQKMNQILIEMGYIVVCQQNKSSIASKKKASQQNSQMQMHARTDSSSSGGGGGAETQKIEYSGKSKQFNKNNYDSPIMMDKVLEEDTFNSNINVLRANQLKERRAQSERAGEATTDDNKSTSSFCAVGGSASRRIPSLFNNNISAPPSIASNNKAANDLSLSTSDTSDCIYECVLTNVVEARSVRFCLSIVCNAVGYLVSQLIRKTLAKLHSPMFGQEYTLYQHILCGQVAELLVFTPAHRQLYLAAVNTEFNLLCKDKVLNFKVNDHELEVYLQEQNHSISAQKEYDKRNNNTQFNPQVGTFNDQGVAGLGKLSIFAMDVRNTPLRKLSGKDGEMDQGEWMSRQQQQQSQDSVAVGNSISSICNMNQQIYQGNKDIAGSNFNNTITGLSNQKTGVNLMKYQQSQSDQAVDCFATVVVKSKSANGNATTTTTTATATTTFTQDSSMISKPQTVFQRDQSKQLFCIDEFVPAKAMDCNNANNESITSDEYSEASSKVRSHQILNAPEEEKDNSNNHNNNWSATDMNSHFTYDSGTPVAQNDRQSLSYPQNLLEIPTNPLETFDFLSKQEPKPVCAVSNTSDDLQQDLTRTRSKSVVSIRSHLKSQYKGYFLQMHVAIHECISASAFYKQLKKAYKLIVTVQQQFVNNAADMMASSNYVQERDNLYPLLRLIILTYLSSNEQHRYILFKLALMIEIIPNEIRTRTYIEELRRLILTLLEIDDNQSELFSSQVYSDTLDSSNNSQKQQQQDQEDFMVDGNDLSEAFEVVEYDEDNPNTEILCCSPQKNHKHNDS